MAKRKRTGLQTKPRFNRKGTLASDGQKRCSKCLRVLPVDEYGNSAEAKDGLSSQCKECCASYALLKLYGITLQEYNKLLGEQGGSCACCGRDTPGRKGRFLVDHCHTTNKVRGLLCFHCNIAIGQFSDDVSVLQKAIDYLSVGVTQ